MSQKPNFLVISTDHWAASLLGAAGHPAIQTPTLDTLARNGVRFNNCYSTCPVCIPARRTLMTGTSPKTHGDRVFQTELPMPEVPTIAETFSDAGYQTYAVGKLHVYPQRDRIGFDDVMLEEEGRVLYGVVDDYEMFLADKGFPGQQFDHGMGNNQYLMRPWHLPEETHATNWATQQMVRTIKRRDPLRPNFWYLSYRHPHPPLIPLQQYLDLYRMIEIDEPYYSEWSKNRDDAPFALSAGYAVGDDLNPTQTRLARMAFYALCTHIDHQLRVVIGTLRDEGLLDNTVILFTSDHGDMLGNHNLWAKRLFYENSANIPMIIMGVKGDERVGYNRIDDRVVCWEDVMPTLLDLAGIDIPDTVEGFSMFGEGKRDWLYGEIGEDAKATRMIFDGHHKLIYYPVGNCSQLFDVVNDPQEMTDLAGDDNYAEILEQLTASLISQLYGGDENWVKDGVLVGLDNKPYVERPNRSLSSQRGGHFPRPPEVGISQFEWEY
jgi:arylsulfatase